MAKLLLYPCQMHMQHSVRLGHRCTHVPDVFFFFNLKIWSPKEQPQPIANLYLLCFHRSPQIFFFSFSQIFFIFFFFFIADADLLLLILLCLWSSFFLLFFFNFFVELVSFLHLFTTYLFLLVLWLAWARDKVLPPSPIFYMNLTHTNTHNLCLLFHYHIIVLMF